MSRLLALQTAFQAAIDANPATFHPHILATRRFPKKQRVEIYVDGYIARLQESFSADFPQLNAFLGNKRFLALTADYILTHPSTVRSLRWYGLDFPAWIHTSSGVKNSAFVAELAEFEGALQSAFDAKEQPILTLQQVSQLSPDAWPELWIQLQPSVLLLNTHYNTILLWQDLDQGKRPRAVQKQKTLTTWKIWRRGYETYFRSLFVPETWAIQVAQQGICFADLCSGLCDFYPEETAALEAATLLKTWIEEEVLSVAH